MHSVVLHRQGVTLTIDWMQWVFAHLPGATLDIQYVRWRWSLNYAINLCKLTHCQYNESVHRKE